MKLVKSWDDLFDHASPALKSIIVRLAIRTGSCGRVICKRRGIMLIYRCPTTAKIVHSGIEASEADVWRLGALKLSLWCPYCQCGHAILGKDTQVDSKAVRSAA
jgi:hypothetical protein